MVEQFILMAAVAAFLLMSTVLYLTLKSFATGS
jgi:archaellin